MQLVWYNVVGVGLSTQDAYHTFAFFAAALDALRDRYFAIDAKAMCRYIAYRPTSLDIL